MTKDKKCRHASRRLLDQLVIWLSDWHKKRVAKSLYNKLWKANDILLYARYASCNSNKYSKYFELLESCSDKLLQAIIEVKKDT